MNQQSARKSKKPPTNLERPVSQERHQSQCGICAHPQREAIDNAFISWRSTAKIAEEYSISRDAIYRHARAMGLLEKRRRNVRAALEQLIERGGEVDVNGATLVAAISAYARINARGEWVERTETVNLNDMFNKMTAAELETYAKTGLLPGWFSASSVATAGEDNGDINAS